MKIFNNSISTTFPLSILSTHHYDLSTVDMFGFDTKQKIREPSFQPQLPEIPLFQPFPHIIYLSLTSRLPSQRVPCGGTYPRAGFLMLSIRGGSSGSNHGQEFRGCS